jgi:hypothetical protein
MQRLMEQISRVVVLALCACACAAMGCGGGTGSPNILEGTTSGGSVHLEIDGGGSSGVQSSHVPASLITVTAKDPTSGAAQMFLGGYLDEGNGVSAKKWQILFTVASAPAAGSVYTIVSQAPNPPPPHVAALSFEEEDPYAVWVGQSGSVAVKSLVGTTATFTVSLAAMSPSAGAATGPFTFYGDMVIDLSNLCNCSD